MASHGPGNELVVAVDFGTTRTAFAITQQGSADDSIAVDVPSGSSSLSTVYDSKTPSNILLDADGTNVIAYGYAAQEKYVGRRSDDCLFFRHFKMELNNSSSQDPMVTALNGRTLPLSAVLAKALEYVKEDVVRKLNAKGLAVQATSIIWVVTVPAIWNDWAKEMMRTAVHRAGMIREVRSPNLKIALEPECACISVQMEKVQGVLSDVGQKLMIVDCGGGTVDITAHQVEAVEPLSLKELMAPDGGPYGATQVDAKFYEFLEELIGSSRFETLRTRREFLAITRSWEDKKVSFRGDEDEDDEWFAPLNIGDAVVALNLNGQIEDLVLNWNLNNPDRKVEALTECTVGLSYNLMMSFFEEPIRRIVDKINALIESRENQQSLKGLGWLILAGGFGRSPVLQNKIQDNFKDSYIRVVVCRHPDLAIVKGAAAFGARPSVFESRKAKYTYGIGSSRIFDPRDPQHQENEGKKHMGPDGKWRLDTFHIHGKVGDDIMVGSQSMRGTYGPLTPQQDYVNFPILASRSLDVFMADEPGVRTLGSWRVQVDKSLPFEERMYQVEFSFGETETFCKCYNGTSGVQIHELEVNFPSDLHWNCPTTM